MGHESVRFRILTIHREQESCSVVLSIVRPRTDTCNRLVQELCHHGILAGFQGTTIIAEPGPICVSSMSMSGRDSAMQPSVGVKPGRARCRKMALPFPLTRGRSL